LFGPLLGPVDGYQEQAPFYCHIIGAVTDSCPFHLLGTGKAGRNCVYSSGKTLRAGCPRLSRRCVADQAARRGSRSLHFGHELADACDRLRERPGLLEPMSRIGEPVSAPDRGAGKTPGAPFTRGASPDHTTDYWRGRVSIVRRWLPRPSLPEAQMNSGRSRRDLGRGLPLIYISVETRV